MPILTALQHGAETHPAQLAVQVGDDRLSYAQLRDAVLERYRSALRFYADPDFWDTDAPGGALIHDDAGATARAALAGRELPIEAGEGP